EALTVAKLAWDSFPERRGYAWVFLAVAHCGLGRADAALEVLERAERENDLWRLRLLRLPELEPLRTDPRFDALTKRAEARVASRNFQARLLLAEPEPAVATPTLLLGLHGATSTAAGDATGMYRGFGTVQPAGHRNRLLLGRPQPGTP